MFARLFCVSLALTLVSLARGAAADETAIPSIGPTGEIVKLHTGFGFTEGPAADAEGNVYFSDVPNSRVSKVDANGKLSVFRDPSNHTNGIMVNAAGELVCCEMDGRVSIVARDGKTVRPLAETYEGKRFNAPNDLVVDRSGGVYFTDPQFRAPPSLPQGVTAVYYVTADGKVSRLIDDLKAPNGVILSPDEKTLYVVPSMQEEMMAYPVEAPGKLGKGRVFCRTKQAEGKQGTGGDGLTIDEKGNLYIATALGLQVFSAKGKALGIIEFPEPPANATFGGKDRKTLYVTARTSLYTAPMEVAGHVFPGGKK
ncbi:MAG TPA: SMP-30/gluconolactonase/LRE family protein [Pirellulales bacterium]|nr:SMP-30/gluconolactonase/LRE family protein [Pirellulales bacterium]